MKTLTTCLLALLTTSALAAEKPNIVLILCDDLGYADVGFNGSPDIVTPQLDKLAAEGTIFSSAYVVHPFCGPSRMGLMTGRYPHAFGAPYNLPNGGQAFDGSETKGVPIGEQLISETLQAAGYTTGAVGKWHMGDAAPFHPNKRGFDDFYGFLGGGHGYFPDQFRPVYERQIKAGNTRINDYLKPLEHNGKTVDEKEYITDAISREAVRFVKQSAAQNDPFFLYVAYNAPHSPLEAKQEDMAQFPKIKDEKRRTYAGMVYAVDRGVGKLVEALKSTGEFDNTLIVFLSDNGGKLGLGANNAPLREGKGSTFEGGFRVPMFFHWPKVVPAGKRFEYPVTALDFYPTFAALAGAKLPAGKQLDGRNIWEDFLAGRNPREGGMIYALRHRDGFSDIGARRDQWKIVRNMNSTWRLYDLEKDISEKNDLSAQHPERLEEMVAEAQKWSRTHTEPQWFDSQKVADGWKAHNMPNYDEDFKISALRKTTTLQLVNTSNSAPAAAKIPQGKVIYSESFDKDPGYVGAKGPNDNNISSIAFGGGNAGFPMVPLGQYAGTSQYLADSAILGSTSKGAFALGSGSKVDGKSRNRSYVTFIDTSALEVGQYNVSFDVSDFQSTDKNTPLYFHLYEGKAEQGHVKMQLTSQAVLPELVSTRPLVTTALGGINYEVLVDNPIGGNGKFGLSFGLTEVGQPGNYLALVWSQVKLKGDGAVPSMTIDNVTVSKLAAAVEPAAAVPASPLGQARGWKIVPAVSDEFEGQQVNPIKWNSNPGSWGAWSWDEDNALQESGKLKLRMVHEPHSRNDVNLFYKSGIIRSHQQMTYGYYEARIKGCQLFPGACPSFWIYSNGRKYTGEVRYCEIDFVELLMNQLNHETKQRDPAEHIEMNLHLKLADKDGKVSWLRPPSHPELCASSWTAPWDPRDDFHVYGCDVTKETITWFIDGKQVAQKPNKYWHEPMNVTLSLGLRHPHLGWVGQDMKPVPQAATGDGFPTEMEVDYVRVWQRE